MNQAKKRVETGQRIEMYECVISALTNFIKFFNEIANRQY